MYSLGFKDKKKRPPPCESGLNHAMISPHPIGTGHNDSDDAPNVVRCVLLHATVPPSLAFATLIDPLGLSPHSDVMHAEVRVVAFATVSFSYNKFSRLVLICVHLNIEKFPMNRYAHYLH